MTARALQLHQPVPPFPAQFEARDGDHLPATPGVYGIVTPERPGEVIYIGATENLLGRACQHAAFTIGCACRTKLDELKWSRDVRQLPPLQYVVLQLTPTKREAQAAERGWIRAAIDAGHPLLNTLNRGGR